MEQSGIAPKPHLGAITRCFIAPYGLLRCLQGPNFNLSGATASPTKNATMRLNRPGTFLNKIVPADLSVERRAFDAQDAGGAAFVPAGGVEGAEDVFALYVG